MEIHSGLEVLSFICYDNFLTWLDKNWQDDSGFWIKVAKIGNCSSSLNYTSVRECCLIYGWIDGLTHKYTSDPTFYLVRVMHRRRGSTWSKINVGIVRSLILEKKIMPNGLREFDEALQDGRIDKAY
jgi:uncharacterized protein YdeI (YjbR/CyaY-like superfamily)